MFKINWLDYVFIFILIVSAIRGASTGMLTGIIRLVGLIVSFGSAVLYHAKVAQWLAYEWGWADTIASLLKPLVKLPEPFNSSEILKFPVELLEKISSQIPLPKPWTDIISQLGQMGSNQTVGQAINMLLAGFILKILAFIGIFLIVKAAIGFVGSLVSVILSISPLGPLNRLAGLTLGLVTGIVIILIIITVLVPLQVPLALLGAQGILGNLENGISNSYFINHFSPLVQSLDIFPSFMPDFSSQLLFKHINNGSGTDI